LFVRSSDPQPVADRVSDPRLEQDLNNDSSALHSVPVQCGGKAVDRRVVVFCAEGVPVAVSQVEEAATDRVTYRNGKPVAAFSEVDVSYFFDEVCPQFPF